MRSPIKTAFVLGVVSSMLALGCELIVDFDRTKIVGEDVPETGTPDTNIPTTDATTDTGTDAADTGTDAPADTDAADAATDG